MTGNCSHYRPLTLPWRLGAVAAFAFLAPSAGAALPKERIVEEGVAVEWSMARVSGAKDAPLTAGEDVVVRFEITDAASGAPVRAANPAGWLDLLPRGKKPEPGMRFKKAATFIEGNLFSRAEVDLNVYHVLALNGDGTITVVDPLFGFGSTKMLALPKLASRGEDWVLARDQRYLFVSLPASMQVAAVNTSSWEVDAAIHTGVGPGRLGIQPDGQYLWVANRGSGTESGDAGVTAVVRSTLETKTHLPTGADPVDIDFTDDSRYAFVANGLDGTLAVIDVPGLRVLHRTPIGKSARSVAYSELAGMAFVIDGKSGKIAGVLPEDGKLAVELQSDPGLSDIQFAPGGRFALIPNPEKNIVLVLDTASRKIVHRIALEGRPTRVAYSDLNAYVSHEESTDVSMLPVAQLNEQGAVPSFASFPAGQTPMGRDGGKALASRIVAAPTGDAVLVANPKDKVVYYYKEGMAAPMGSFSNYSREPKAVTVVDRSLQERTAPGVYETVVRLPKAGTYETIFYLDAPRRVHSFVFDVAPNPGIDRGPDKDRFEIAVSLNRRTIRAGEPLAIQFRIFDRKTGKPVDGLKDLRMLAYKAPSGWNDRMSLASTEKPGVYGAALTPPEEGQYNVHLESPTLGLGFSNNRQMILDVAPPSG